MNARALTVEQWLGKNTVQLERVPPSFTVSVMVAYSNRASCWASCTAAHRRRRLPTSLATPQPRAALTKSAFFTASFCHRLLMSSGMAAGDLGEAREKSDRRMEQGQRTGG